MLWSVPATGFIPHVAAHDPLAAQTFMGHVDPDVQDAVLSHVDAVQDEAALEKAYAKIKEGFPRENETAYLGVSIPAVRLAIRVALAERSWASSADERTRLEAALTPISDDLLNALLDDPSPLVRNGALSNPRAESLRDFQTAMDRLVAGIESYDAWTAGIRAGDDSMSKTVESMRSGDSLIARHTAERMIRDAAV